MKNSLPRAAGKDARKVPPLSALFRTPTPKKTALSEVMLPFRNSLTPMTDQCRNIKACPPCPSDDNLRGHPSSWAPPWGQLRLADPMGEPRDCIRTVSLQILLPSSSMVLISRILPKNCPSHLIFISEFFPGETNLSQLLSGVVQESNAKMGFETQSLTT